MPGLRQFGQMIGPTHSQLAAYADQLGLHMSDEGAAMALEAITIALQSFDALEAIPQAQMTTRHAQRDPGRVPTSEEDPYNAFIRFCDVRGAATGRLAGRRVAVKDCIAVAGVPTTDGGYRMPATIPSEDAVVVERLLEAGATIVGKTNMEDSAMGLGEGSHYGAALNPLNPRYSTGGSSSGSAAAVASAAADFAIGADEGGSIRIPSAWCGIVGMKASHGLVPSYGLSYMDHTIDHIGPMTKTVAENAEALGVLAGSDWRDPQWARFSVDAPSYTENLDAGIRGRRVGVIRQALACPDLSDEVARSFEAATEIIRSLGADVVEVDLPMWDLATAIFFGCMTSSHFGMLCTFGAGFGHLGRIDPDAVAMTAARSRLAADDLPPILKHSLLTAVHVRTAYLGVPFATAHNLRLQLRKEISSLFRDLDLLITPTTPNLAFELLDRRGTTRERLSRAGAPALRNTCPFALSGHPALTVPCGRADQGTGIGLQIIGAHLTEQLVYQAGAAFESVLDLR